jgi:hypothetical protein
MQTEKHSALPQTRASGYGLKSSIKDGIAMFD